MDRYDYHFISIKFLTAILLALIFAFLLIYVFTPQKKESYNVFNIEREEIRSFSEIDLISSRDQIFSNTISEAEAEFENGLRDRSFKVMASSRDSILSVITANHLEKMNGLREEKMTFLAEKEEQLENEENRLLQQRRSELEAELSSELENIRREVRNKYSDYNQKEIRDNYLEIINLRIKIEVVAHNQSEIEKYKQILENVRAEQQELLAEKNSRLNSDISEKTGRLIMEFNQNFAEYREKINREHQKILAAEEAEIEKELAQAREKIKEQLARARSNKEQEINQLITESKEKYY